ncbi:MAG: HypC/HybG/HupF family hydrogenase formation chaperone, partial [Desulfobaccales bacterium]
MCLAIPMRLIEIDGACGVAEVDGVSRQVRLDL